jgi:hypothetical protein
VGWKSAEGLATSGYGSRHTISRRMVALWQALLDDVIATGALEVEAVTSVERGLIGWKKPPRGRAALYASPRAVALLDLEHKDHRKEKWLSAEQLRREFKGSREAIEQKLDNLRSSLIADIVAKGIEKDVADGVVECQFIRRIQKLYDAAPICASPAAVRLLEEDGLLRRRWKDRVQEPPEKDSKATPER